MTGVGRLGRVLLTGYFGLLAVFLYVPLVVLVIFAFNEIGRASCRERV